MYIILKIISFYVAQFLSVLLKLCALSEYHSGGNSYYREFTTRLR